MEYKEAPVEYEAPAIEERDFLIGWMQGTLSRGGEDDGDGDDPSDQPTRGNDLIGSTHCVSLKHPPGPSATPAPMDHDRTGSVAERPDLPPAWPLFCHDPHLAAR